MMPQILYWVQYLYNKYFELKNLWGTDGVPQGRTTYNGEHITS